ncbi:exodeoxyribonuclease VII small subunit [Demequina gelatinilytica]|uniref:exodeoxyribonuclease VII small subunit n=1 Tax=Demequina gelatinilytica TaxID=1638980 RepID=UPI000784F952|nr:exodeoxyribonuclease VII small subunit [Demequina gelatinilytica]
MSNAAAPSERPVESLSYEEARDELISIVARLEGGSATLEDSLGLWERGEALAARCQALLDGAYARIAEAGDDGEASDAGIVGIVPAEEDEEADR